MEPHKACIAAFASFHYGHDLDLALWCPPNPQVNCSGDEKYVKQSRWTFTSERDNSMLASMPAFTEEIPEEGYDGSLQMFLQMSLEVIPSVAKVSQDSEFSQMSVKILSKENLPHSGLGCSFPSDSPKVT